MNNTISSDYDRFQFDLMLNPSRNSSFTWNIRTLRSRDVLVENAMEKATGVSRKLLPKSRNKIRFVQKIVNFLTCSNGIEREPAAAPSSTVLEKNRRLRSELNDLQLVSLSYKAEMNNLREEIENLQKEKLKLEKRRQTAPRTMLCNKKQFLHKTQSSSGCSSMKSREKSESSLEWVNPIDPDTDILFIC